MSPLTVTLQVPHAENEQQFLLRQLGQPKLGACLASLPLGIAYPLPYRVYTLTKEGFLCLQFLNSVLSYRALCSRSW